MSDTGRGKPKRPTRHAHESTSLSRSIKARPTVNTDIAGKCTS